MQYRVLGKTGMRVSALGFGAMRLPMRDDRVDEETAIPMLRRALELGVNYVDSAFGYCNSTSEIAVGKAIAAWPRDRVHLSTKLPVRSQEDVAEWRSRLETQLRRFDTDYVDIHNCHGLKWEEFCSYVAVPGGVLEQARRAQGEGLIRHLSLSCHDTPDNMRRLIDTGEFASITLQYNLLDRTNADVISYAYEKGMGVVVMGPVGGGRLGVSSDIIRGFLPEGRRVKSTPEIALRFVLSHPGVAVALSGMSTMRQVEENVATASRAEPLSQAELRHVEEALDETRRLADLYCTGCGYCLPCPNEVKIPDNFRLMNYHRLYGLTEYARREYARLVAQGGSADQCQECGQCEPKCPQSLRIVDQLREVAAGLGRSPSSGG